MVKKWGARSLWLLVKDIADKEDYFINNRSGVCEDCGANARTSYDKVKHKPWCIVLRLRSAAESARLA